MTLERRQPKTLDIIGRQPPAKVAEVDGAEISRKEITDIIAGFSMTRSAGDSGLIHNPINRGESDYSHWEQELQRMTPDIEETLTSIWGIANIWHPVDRAQAKFEAKMCVKEVFAFCHQRTRQKRFLYQRKFLAEEALIHWADGTGEPWQVPETLWEDLHLYDTDYQNAVMDLSSITSEESAMQALSIWQNVCDDIAAIDESIRRDKERKIFADHSQTVDALLSIERGDKQAVLDAIKKNTTAYW